MKKYLDLDAAAIRGFCNSLLINKFETATQVPDFHMEIWKLLCGPDKRIAIAAPRGHAKSTAITFTYALAAALFRSSSYILICSATYEQAVKFLFELRTELQNNTDLCRLFGFDCFIKEREEEIVLRFVDGYECCLMARGAGQSIRGAKWNNQRPDLIICDDIESDDSVGTSGAREGMANWFFATLLNLLSPKGRLFIIGTILHTDSLLNHFMPAWQLQQANIQNALVSTPLKEYTEHKLPWKSIKYRAYSDDFEHILWPDRFTKEFLQDLRDVSIAARKLDIHRQEMLNIPYDESRALFVYTDFKAMDREDYGKRLEYYIGIDLAVSTAQHSDYSAFVVAGMDAKGMLYVVDVIHQKIDTSKSVETMVNLQKKYNPQYMAMEKGVIDRSIGPFLNKEMMKRNTFIQLKKIAAVGDKRKRAQSIAGRMQVGGIKFDKESDWFYSFQSELLSFTGSNSSGQHDDQVDAFAYLGLMLASMDEAPTEEEIEEEEYEEEYRQSGLADNGRSKVTGY